MVSSSGKSLCNFGGEKKMKVQFNGPQVSLVSILFSASTRFSSERFVLHIKFPVKCGAQGWSVEKQMKSWAKA